MIIVGVYVARCVAFSAAKQSIRSLVVRTILLPTANVFPTQAMRHFFLAAPPLASALTLRGDVELGQVIVADNADSVDDGGDDRSQSPVALENLEEQLAAEAYTDMAAENRSNEACTNLTSDQPPPERWCGTPVVPMDSGLIDDMHFLKRIFEGTPAAPEVSEPPEKEMEVDNCFWCLAPVLETEDTISLCAKVRISTTAC